MPRISVLFPVHVEHPNLGVAIDCIRSQTFDEFEIVFLANGPGAPSRERLIELSQGDPRARVICIKRPQLAAALNIGIREAKGEYLARMDGDDRCTTDRFQKQIDALLQSPDCIAVNGGYTCEGADGRVRGICLPPSNPREGWWRLHLQNIYAHGAMMMKREALLREMGGECGGESGREGLLYNEAFDRSQDYELWLRMGPRITAVQDLVYTFTTSGDSYASSPLQARFSARCISQAWERLPVGVAGEYQEFLALGMLGDSQGARALKELEACLSTRGPTVAGLLAYQWLAARVQPQMNVQVDRERTVQQAAKRLVGCGVSEVYLWGAGAHTTWALPILREQGVDVVGIVDDYVAGQERCGYVVRHPRDIPDGSHVLVSSDRAERTIVQQARVLRGPAVHVHTIYAAA